MTDARPDQLVEDWAEEEQRLREETEVLEAGEVERAQLLDIKRYEDGDEWLDHVDAYAKRCLEELGSAPRAPAPEDDDIEKGATNGQPQQHQYQQQQQQQQQQQPDVQKVTSSTPRGIRGLTRTTKLHVRNVIVACIALLLPFFEKVQTISYGTSLLIPILALILMLRPPHLTSVGLETQQLLVFLASWPFYVAWSLVIVAASPHNIIGFLILLSLGILVGFLVGMTHPSALMILLGPTIMISIIHMTIWQINNFSDYEDPFRESLMALGGATFGLVAAFGLQWLGAVLIFPWHVLDETRQALSNRYAAYAAVLRCLRPAYDRIAIHTLDPSAPVGPTSLSAELIQAIEDARQKEISSISVSLRCVCAAVLETRFFGRGDGLAYLRRYHDTLNLTRNARSSAADIVNHKEDFLGPAEGDGSIERFLRHKDIFLQQDAIQASRMKAGEDHGAQRALEQARERIPILITKLNLLLELGAHRLAQLAGSGPSRRAEEEMRGRMFGYLAREQVAMDALGEELEEHAVSWMEHYLRTHAAEVAEGATLSSFFKRTKLVSYVLVLLRLAREQKEIVAAFKKESTQIEGAAWREWTITFPFHDGLVPRLHASKREELYTPIASRFARWEHRLLALCGSNAWKLSLKFAFGSTLLVLPAMIDPFYKKYSAIQLLNGIFTFQVVIFWSQTGLVVERVVQRLIGITIGAISLSVAWELACINGCTDGNRKWVLFAVEVVYLFGYLWFKARWPTRGYIGFSVMRTLASMSTGFVTAADPGAVNIWRQSGYVLASSAIGAGGALFLTIAIWPMSGRYMLREAIARSYHDFVLITESVIAKRYEDPTRMDTMTSSLSAFEHKIAHRLYMETGPMMRSAHLETVQRINFDAPNLLYVKAVKSSQEIWQSLWKLNHLGGVHMYVDGPDGRPAQTMDPRTARAFLAAQRWLSTSFAAVASQLNGKHRDSAPVLRPLAATPRLFEEMLNDFTVRAYSDEKFLDHVVSSRDLGLMLNLPLLIDSLYDVSKSLDQLYTLMETYLRTPVYADRLREAEAVSVNLYSKKKNS